MGRLKTTKEFVEEMVPIHKGTYTYELVEYKKAQKKVWVTCRIHGPFEITPDAHRSGQGCAKCKAIKIGNHNRGNLEDSVRDSTINHNGKYDYSLITEYTDDRTKVPIICPDHGVFWMNFNSHKSARQGCYQCRNERIGAALRDDLSTKVQQATEAHNGKYNYSLITDYKNNSTKVEIVCPVHGSFWMNFGNHIQGKQHCPQCSNAGGYKRAKPGTFYILTCNNLTKVGITNRDVKLRVKDINKSSKEDFKISSTFFFDNGEIPHKIEQEILTWLGATYKPVDKVFDGSTECFIDVDQTELLNKVIAKQILTHENELTST